MNRRAGASRSKNFTQCDSMLIGDKCAAITIPYIEGAGSKPKIEHEASTSKISEDMLFYCQSRGLDEEQAMNLIVNGFVKDIPFSKRHRSRQDLQNVQAGLEKLAEKPTQLIWGMKDWCFNATCLAKFKEHFPASASLEIDDAGHYVLEDAREEVVASVQSFLRQQA